MANYGPIIKIGHLYYRGRQFSESEMQQNKGKKWDILSSGNPESIKLAEEKTDPNIPTSHDHYWKRNEDWYQQIRVGDTHAIDFEKVVQEENDRKNLGLTNQQIKEEADRRTLTAYPNSDYSREDGNIGLKMDEYNSHIMDNIAQEYETNAERFRSQDEQIEQEQTTPIWERTSNSDLDREPFQER